MMAAETTKRGPGRPRRVEALLPPPPPPQTPPAPRKAAPGADLLTLDEAADFLRMSRRSLERALTEGKGPPSVKPPRSRRYFLREDLQRWLDEARA